MNQLINFNSSINNIFDDLFNNTLTNFVGSDFASNIPAVNISEATNDFKIELAVPGLEKEDFKINVEKDQLTISVKKENSTEVTDEKFTRKEFNYSAFTRNFLLPEGVESRAITANYENGILGIVLPKKEEAKELPPRTIDIK